MSNLTQRSLTAIVGITLALSALWVGGLVFGVVLALACAAAQIELYALMRKAHIEPLVWLGVAVGITVSMRALHPYSEPVLMVGSAILLVTVLYRRRGTPLLDAAGTAFGVLYPAAMLGSILILRDSSAPWLGAHGGFWVTAAVLFGIWGADTAAYFAGRTLGKHKLMPEVSPNKTWEGAVGGALGAMALIAAFKLVVLGDVLSWMDIAVMGAACGLAGPLGDLAESLFKRSVDTKDSGTWIPGHGGMLDRLDAAVVAVPLVVAYLELAKGLS